MVAKAIEGIAGPAMQSTLPAPGPVWLLLAVFPGNPQAPKSKLSGDRDQTIGVALATPIV
jgi:hypothetical protein